MLTKPILLAATAIFAVIPAAIAAESNVGLFTHFYCEKASVQQGIERCGGGVGNAHCAFVVQSTAGPYVLCNACEFTPQQTAGCWPTYFTFPKPPAPPPKEKTITVTKTGTVAITIYRTVLVGASTKTIMTEVDPFQTKTVQRTEYVYVIPDGEDATTIKTRTLAQQTKTVTATKTGDDALTIYRTVYVGSRPTRTMTEVNPYKTITVAKTVYVVAYPTDQDTVTVSTRVPNTAASTITKTITEDNNVKTIYIVYIGGRPIRTDIPTKTIYKTIGNGGGNNIKIIYIIMPDGTTKTIRKTLDSKTMVKTITRGKQVVTTVITVTAPLPASSDEPEPVDSY
ncbi:uncharacterized protein DFL_001422 [Arthrobotrys flagrans]|uniref:Uncharacterized protein n=1 Tax=Arthrobotrys flagrans TaxID=97331 RepID=A0A437A7L2_ARTFL|nr:hypothetical protein DFL_001422 [Arthrobotrys flagrans]